MNLYDDKSKMIRDIESDIKSISFPYNGLGLEPEPKPPNKIYQRKSKIKRKNKILKFCCREKESSRNKT